MIRHSSINTPLRGSAAGFQAASAEAAGRQEALPEEVKAEDGLQIPDRNGRTEQIPDTFTELTCPHNLN